VIGRQFHAELKFKILYLKCKIIIKLLQNYVTNYVHSDKSREHDTTILVNIYISLLCETGNIYIYKYIHLFTNTIYHSNTSFYTCFSFNFTLKKKKKKYLFTYRVRPLAMPGSHS
jgi:hypothetical protein